MNKYTGSAYVANKYTDKSITRFSNAVNIMRGSRYGNPFSHQGYGEYQVNSRDEAVDSYRDWLLGIRYTDFNQSRRLDILKNLNELKGCVLVCCCKPKRCHGDVLIELIDKL